MNHLLRLGIISLVTVAIAACTAEELPESPVEGRWYTQEQLDRGQDLYREHCAVCHGQQAEGLAEDWKKPDANGNYPPPPLNGTAHAWHHPTEVLLRTIENGGAPVGGVMPAFGSVLESNEALDVVAFFQSLWTDEIYERWLSIENR